MQEYSQVPGAIMVCFLATTGVTSLRYILSGLLLHSNPVGLSFFVEFREVNPVDKRNHLIYPRKVSASHRCDATSRASMGGDRCRRLSLIDFYWGLGY